MDPTLVSDAMFGRRCRLFVADWVRRHPKGRFYQSEPPVIRHASASNVRDELRRLVRLGMLELDEPPDSRKKFYTRTDSPLWQVIELAVDLTGLAEAGDG